MRSAVNDGGTLAAAEGVRWRDRTLLGYGRGFEHPSKIRIVRWLVRKAAAGRIRVRYAQGATIAIDPADYIGWAVFKTGHYERASLSLALRIMTDEPGLFIDVGANFGWYSCAVAAIPGAAVVSIEPDCQNCASLRENIALNKLSNVIVFNGAIGTAVEIVRMARRSPANSGTCAMISDDAASTSGDNRVATVPLDLALNRMVDPPARPVLVKVDVEGFEPQVLAGLDFDGSFRPKNFLMEVNRELFSRPWGPFPNLKAFFAGKGYELLDVFGRPCPDDGELPEENVWAREASR